MNLESNNVELNKMIAKFQEGGEIPPQEASMEGAPAQEAPAENPMDQIMQAAAQALQTQDCNLAMQILQAILQGGEQAPAEPQGEPVYKRGGKLVKRI